VTHPTDPQVSTELPGPRSRALLEHLDRMMYPGLRHGLAPFVMARKHDHVVEDIDGNVFWDFVSASASVPFGAAPRSITDAAVDAMRRYGLEDTHGIANELVAPLAEALLQVAPAGLTRVDIALNGTEAVETAFGSCGGRPAGRSSSGSWGPTTEKRGRRGPRGPRRRSCPAGIAR